MPAKPWVGISLHEKAVSSLLLLNKTRGTAKSLGQNTCLQKILHPLWVIAVAFTANPLHFLYLASLASCLDVLEVNIWILTKVYNGTQEIEQP